MRRIVKLMEDWQFTYQGRKKRLIDLPHTWNAVDGQDGNDDYFRGTCVYEKKIPMPEFSDEERVYLQFQGVNASAKVILNGITILTHDNGYSTFRTDVTDVLKEMNELRVEVDNSKNQEVYPQVADFTFYGGIYRDVEFLIVHKTHFDLDYYGGPGLQVSTNVKGKTGFVSVRAYTNKSTKELKKENLTVCLTLSDAQGETAGTAEGTDAVIKVPDAHLWNGVKNPYLYKLTAQIRQEHVVLDQIETFCGIRTFSFDPDKGFFLNGVSYPLRGVSRHQDWKGIGNAISLKQMEKDMELIREVGANTIRLAHYQHHSYFYDLCDRYGMVVWAEIPYISAHMPQGRQNTFFQMRELIVQNYNHPCIVTLSLIHI